METDMKGMLVFKFKLYCSKPKMCVLDASVQDGRLMLGKSFAAFFLFQDFSICLGIFKI